MALGENLRYYRKKKKFTQEELASGICAATYLSKIENDKITPNIETLKLICEKLDITVADVEEKDYSGEIKLIERLLNYISQRDKKEAKRLFNEMDDLLLNITDPYMIGQYRTAELRYYLSIKDKDRANKIKGIIDAEFMDYLSPKYSLIYTQSLGLYEYLFGSISKAKEYYIEANQIADQLYIRDPEFYFQMAMVFSRNNNITMSIYYTEKALGLFSEKMDFKRSADCQLILGINFNRIHEYPIAIDYFEKLLTTSEQLENPEIIRSKVYHNMGMSFSGLGQSQKAIDSLNKSIEFYKDPAEKIMAHYLLVKEYMGQGEDEKASHHLDEGAFLAEDKQDFLYEVKFNLLKFKHLDASLNIKYRDYIIETALPYAKEKSYNLYCECLELLGSFYRETFHYKEAVHYFELALHYRKRSY
ncbi:helix-turn-helix domain-containing protein [Lentibacillus sediminis]|uniref:helix-turn-helix domain-containing protein n=1 Tax=Lentibacillus sediminis TaxID=1940529 RepID=UPI000C1BD0EE|nr:helix-turn-helix transcriptional regulator [Lentibacillus sediminis]